MMPDIYVMNDVFSQTIVLWLIGLAICIGIGFLVEKVKKGGRR